MMQRRIRTGGSSQGGSSQGGRPRQSRPGQSRPGQERRTDRTEASGRSSRPGQERRTDRTEASGRSSRPGQERRTDRTETSGRSSRPGLETPSVRPGRRKTRSDGIVGPKGAGRKPATRFVRSRSPEVTSPGAGEERPGFVAGRHPVLEALKAGRPINKILVSNASEGGSLIEILGKARAGGVVVQTVPKAHLQKIAGDGHQGIIAYVAPREYVELDDIIAVKSGEAPLVVLMDEVSDPHNFGAVLRTAEAAGAQGVVIPKRRAVPLTETVAKAAAGAVEYVPVARVANLVQAIDRLKQAGYWIVGADVDATELYTQVDYTGATAVVIGAESKGLSRLVKEHCDHLVRLPMKGRLQSLNASVAAGVLLYEAVRQRG